MPAVLVAFEFVRDNISHSWDAKDPRVTLSASDVLRQAVGSVTPRRICSRGCSVRRAFRQGCVTSG